MHTCAIDRSCMHGRMANPYRRKIGSLRNASIINYWRTHACKWNRRAICTLSTFQHIHNSLIEAFNIINGT